MWLLRLFAHHNPRSLPPRFCAEACSLCALRGVHSQWAAGLRRTPRVRTPGRGANAWCARCFRGRHARDNQRADYCRRDSAFVWECAPGHRLGAHYRGVGSEGDGSWRASKCRGGGTCRCRSCLRLCCAGKSSPCTNCSNAFAEQWGDDPWHCFKCKRDAPFLDAAVRKGPEETAKKAVVAVDAPFVSTGSSLTAEGEARHAGRAVRVRFLLLLLASLPESARRTVKTGELVALLIKPATARWRCRFVELPGMSMHIGKPRVHSFHTSGARSLPTSSLQ